MINITKEGQRIYVTRSGDDRLFEGYAHEVKFNVLHQDLKTWSITGLNQWDSSVTFLDSDTNFIDGGVLKQWVDENLGMLNYKQLTNQPTFFRLVQDDRLDLPECVSVTVINVGGGDLWISDQDGEIMLKPEMKITLKASDFRYFREGSFNVNAVGTIASVACVLR